MKATLADWIDPRTAVIVGLSLFVHVGIATWALLTDGEVDRPSFASNGVYHPTVQDEPIEIDADQLPAVATPVAPVAQTPAPIVRPTRAVDKPLTVAEAQQYAAFLTGNDPGADGRHEMQRRQVGGDLRDQIDEVTRNGRNVRIGNESGTRDETARRGSDRGLQLDNQGDVDHMAKADEKPVLTPLPAPGPKQRHTLTMEMVLAKIQGAYMAGLQRCYKHALAGDGGASGKVTLAFTVDERGHVGDAEAHGVTSELDTCIAGQMTSWLFPIPKDEDGDADEASFKLSLAFQRAD